MRHFLKTELGLQALKQRTLNLNARQRRLLLLIGTDDFQALNPEIKLKLAQPELLQQLEELGLIFSTEKSISVASTPNVEKPTNILNEIIFQKEPNPSSVNIEMPSEILFGQKNEVIIEPQSDEIKQEPIPTAQSQEEIVHLDFNEVKDLMISSLKQYCGLMAKRLIMQIDGSENLRALKLCQMQWITALQETRIPPVHLNKTLQQINLSLQEMRPS